MIVTALWRTLLARSVNVASPPLMAAVPSLVIFSFFLIFVTNSIVTSPVGTPSPGAEIAWHAICFEGVQHPGSRRIGTPPCKTPGTFGR